MADHTFYGYSTNAFAFDPSTGQFTLDAGYDPTQDRVRFEITDDDAFVDGDQRNNETGDDSNQTGTIYDSQGNIVQSGNVYVEQFATLRAPDGTLIEISRFEVNGVLVGYVPSSPIDPGVNYDVIATENAHAAKQGGKNSGEARSSNSDTRKTYDYYQANSVACFGPGTMIATQEGDMPVEWLETSDKVLTRDHGFQPILWISRTKLPAGYFQTHPEGAPVCIPAGALGPDSPTHDLIVTGDHRLFIQAFAAELYFASHEVLAPAKAWVDAGLASQMQPEQPFTLTHILCQSHQIIAAQGAWVESMFTGAEMQRGLSDANKREIEQIMPGRALNRMRSARPCLTRREGAFLLAQTSQDAKLLEARARMSA